MKMPLTLKCVCLFTSPHPLPQSLSHKKAKLVQRLLQKLENSKQLFWKAEKKYSQNRAIDIRALLVDLSS